MTWLSQRDLAEPANVRLFCLPHAGSGAAGFYRWKRLLPPTIAVCPVMLPGREARISRPSLTSVTAIVDALHAEARPHLARPYAIFGHSMSALIAFEWARRIQQENLPQPLCLFVSGRNAPTETPGHRDLHRLADEDMVRELGRRYGGDADLILNEPDLREVFLPIIRADLTVVETYNFIEGPPLECPVRALAGVDDHSVSPQGLTNWSRISSPNFAERRLTGDHFYHLGASQSELLAFLQQQCH
jgi:medium-chain acyl-[acyl-carrier-protein] hydrolase